MLEVMKIVQDMNDQITKELSEIKDRIMQTSNMVEGEVCWNFQILVQL